MKISRNSWHFRFLKYANASKAMDIDFDVRRGKYYSECRYFWLILWTLISRGICALVVGWFCLGIVLGMILAPHHLYLSYMNQTPVDLGTFDAIGLGMWFLLFFALVQFILAAACKVIFKNRKPKAERNDGLFKSFVKSKKEKVCKPIEFVD